jgi:ribosomal protein S18 acetylase RimI-like enzyme
VPRAWAHVWLAGAHREGPDRIPVDWRDRWAAESSRYGDPSLPETLDDAPNAGLPLDASQAAAERRSTEIAEVARHLAIPCLIREAVDRGWWSPLAVREASPAPPPIESDGSPTIVDRPDRAMLDRLEFAPRLVAGLDPSSLRAIVNPALVDLTVAVSAADVVGLVASVPPASAADGDRRSILAIGVTPDYRRRGLATELLARHVASFDPGTAWSATVTAAERDPIEPLDRAVRATIARRLLERAGLEVRRASGDIGRADPLDLDALMG